MNQTIPILNLSSAGVQLLLIQLLVFVSVALACGGVAWLLLKRNPAAKRLSKLLEAKPPRSQPRQQLIEKEEGGLVGKLTTPLQGIFSPSKAAGRQQLRLRLQQAGFSGKRSYRNYLALQVLLTFLLPLAFLLRSMFFRFTPPILAIILGLALIGYLLPGLFLRILIHGRQQRISRALPDALDLMVICVEAGLGLDMTIKRVGEEVRSICPDLSDELILANREVQAGRPRSESFRNLGLRTGVPEVQNLMTLLTQTNRFGTSMAKALRVHASSMRIKRRQHAEERAAKSAVKLVLPLVFCIFPAILVVLAGPAVLRIMTSVLPFIRGG